MSGRDRRTAQLLLDDDMRKAPQKCNAERGNKPRRQPVEFDPACLFDAFLDCIDAFKLIGPEGLVFKRLGIVQRLFNCQA